MARSFSVSSYLERTGVSSFGAPLTLALWANLNSTAALQVLLSCDEASGGDICELYVTSAGKLALYAEQQGIGNISIVGTTTISTGTWTHLAVACSSGDSQIWVNGASDGTSSTARTISTLTQFHVGTRRYSGGLGDYANGKIAEAAVYSARLATADIASLAKGYTPECVRRQDIMAYWPLGGHRGQHDNDHWKNGNDMTAYNSPTWADHGRVIYPRRRVWNVAWSSPATYTATVSASHAGMSAAVTASHTRPTYTASVAATSGGMSAAVSASHTTPTYTATVAATAGAMTASASAAHVRPTYTASVAASHGAMSCSAAAAHVRPTYTASVSAAVAGMTAAVAASHVAPTYTASVAASCGAMVASATATAAVPAFSAVVSASHGAMTASVSATRTAPTYGATVSATFAGMVAAAISAVPDVDYSVTADTEAVARRLGTESRSRSVRTEAVARRAATESLCRVVRTEALARRLGTEAR